MKDKPNILVVDDTQINVTILVESLSNEYEVSVAMDGQTALDLAAQETPDLILLDVMMPRMDGYEVCEILKNQEKTHNIPVIFLTAKTETEDIVRGFSLGAADYIPKPFQIPELLARVRTHLELQESRELIIQKANEQKELLHVLCHDLANPLTSILGVLELLEESPEELPEYAPLMRDAAVNGSNVISLVREMRALAEKPLKLESINLVDAIKESTSMLSIRLQEKGISLEVDVDPRLTVRAERISFINSVMNNILTNALKFSFPATKIVLKADPEAEQVQISVRDFGIGIPSDLLNDLFDISKATSRPGTGGESGTGFGMPLMKKFVGAYGGSIEVHSSTEGSGAPVQGTEVILLLDRG